MGCRVHHLPPPFRVCVKRDLLRSLMVAAPFDDPPNQGFAEPRASARGVRREFSHRLLLAGLANRFRESPACQSLFEKSGLTAPCGRGSLPTTHAITRVSEPRPREAVDTRICTQTRQGGGNRSARRAH
jgi:hypothetical protein